MKILRIADIPDNRTGGMSRVMYFTGDALQAKGHQVDYMFVDRLGATRYPKLRRFTIPRRIPRLVAGLAEAGQRYDVVEIHEPLGYCYCFRRKRGSRLPPAVLISYGIERRSLERTLAYKHLKNLPISLKQRYSPLTVALPAAYGLRNADHILCANSEDVEYANGMGIPQTRISLYHSGAPAEFLLAGRERPRACHFVPSVLFLGTWTVRKGILDLIPAMTQLLMTHGAVTFTIAGCGCDSATVYREFPGQLHARIKVIPSITSAPELIEVYRAHSIFILPSYFEGQPLAMIEAAAMGLAIVTTSVCGMLDFVRDGINGRLSVPGYPESLFNAIDELIRCPEEARRLALAAQVEAGKFTWEASADAMLHAYQSAVDTPQWPSPSTVHRAT